MCWIFLHSIESVYPPSTFHLCAALWRRRETYVSYFTRREELNLFASKEILTNLALPFRYQLNRSVFSTVYTTVSIFAVLLGLKGFTVTAISFFFAMNIITFLVDRQIQKKFIKPGLTLALTNSRMIDEQNKVSRKNWYSIYMFVTLSFTQSFLNFMI